MQLKKSVLRKGFAILFLLIFSLRPAYYVGQLVYFEMNIDTIIQTYCVNKDKPQMQCNGKCHLAKQLQLTESTDDKKAINILFQAFFPVFIESPKSFDFQSLILQISQKHSFHYVDAYNLDYHCRLYRPPIC